MADTNLRKRFMKQVHDRMHKHNQNWIAVFVGQTGSGKTYGGLECSDELMNGKHNPHYHETFSVDEFIERLPNFKKGDVIVFEEVGVNMNSKNWQSDENKSANFVIQTCRHRNFSLILTTPSLKFLDKSSRELVHHIFKADHIDYKKEIGVFKVYKYVFDPIHGKEPYLVTPRFRQGKYVVKMPYIEFKKPREDILEMYELRKSEFTDKLYKEMETRLKERNTEEKEKEKKTNTMPCSVCGGRAWRHLASTKTYRCRKCGNEISTNPYIQKNDN